MHTSVGQLPPRMAALAEEGMTTTGMIGAVAERGPGVKRASLRRVRGITMSGVRRRILMTGVEVAVEVAAGRGVAERAWGEARARGWHWVRVRSLLLLTCPRKNSWCNQCPGLPTRRLNLCTHTHTHTHTPWHAY